jgi:hypothetical protein
MYRIASRAQADYWRAYYKLTMGLDCRHCNKPQRQKCRSEDLYSQCPKAIKLESLNKPILDGEGNLTELGELIADDKAMELDAWVSDSTWEIGYKPRLVAIAYKLKAGEALANAEIQDSWIETIGSKQLIFEGRGGTGKTMILLGLAWQLQRDRHARVLLLTYNRALVADLRRLLTLMGLSDEIGCPFVEVRTVHSFIYQILEALGLMENNEDNFLERYDDFKREILELLRIGALTQKDFQEMIGKSPEYFAWDYLFVDEAQDWFMDERDILHLLYPPNHFVIADGRDQLIRRDANCDWSEGLEKIPTHTYQLHRGLRMKANLARFVNNLAQEIGLTAWSIQENIEAIGGKIIIVEGDFSHAQNLHTSFIESARVAGNSPVDLLTCIPPGMVENIGQKRRAATAELFVRWNYQVWDGVSEDLRRTYPTSIEQLRIIQYESCRGLEGWTVFNLGIDDFYDYKMSTWTRPTDLGESFVEDSLLAQRFTARWIMIPCTRAIDTLVLNIHNPNSTLGHSLKVIAKRCSDYVEWVRV